MVVERGDEDLSVVVGQPTRDDVAAGDALRRLVLVRNIAPLRSPLEESSANTRFGKELTM